MGIESIVKKIFKSFSPKERKKHIGVLHAYKERTSVRKKILNKVTNKKEQEKFKKNIHKVFSNIEVSIKDHFEEKSLQIADFCSWCVFRKYQWKDSSFCEEISHMLTVFEYKKTKPLSDFGGTHGAS